MEAMFWYLIHTEKKIGAFQHSAMQHLLLIALETNRQLPHLPVGECRIPHTHPEPQRRVLAPQSIAAHSVNRSPISRASALGLTDTSTISRSAVPPCMCKPESSFLSACPPRWRAPPLSAVSAAMTCGVETHYCRKTVRAQRTAH